MISVIEDVEDDLPNQHLIAHTFNDLDYSFTVEHPEGTAADKVPRGGSPARFRI